MDALMGIIKISRFNISYMGSSFSAFHTQYSSILSEAQGLRTGGHDSIIPYGP